VGLSLECFPFRSLSRLKGLRVEERRTLPNCRCSTGAQYSERRTNTYIHYLDMKRIISNSFSVIPSSDINAVSDIIESE